MPYKSFWYRENEVVFTEILGDFNAEEMVNLNKEFDEIYFANSDQTIHLIADLRGMSNYPKNLGLIRDITQTTASQPALGWIVLIGLDNSLIKFFSTTVFQLLGVNCKLVETLEDAEKVLFERIQTVNTNQ